MTLLDSSVNRKVGNTSFQDKCAAAFSHSNLEITKEILNESVWGPKQIEERQKKMAKAACQIWCIALQEESNCSSKPIKSKLRH
jgi:hypothetical protein